MSDFKYGIAGRKFFQRPLVLGQWDHLLGVLEGVDLADLVEQILANDRLRLSRSLGPRIYRALAVALREENKPIREKDVDELAEFLEEEMDAETGMRVVQDFFVCNPLDSLLERMEGMLDSVAQNVRALGKPSNRHA